MINRIRAAIEAYHFHFDNETELQEAIGQALAENGIPFERHPRLSAQDIPDFMIPPGICLEIKIKGSQASVLRQIHRYAQQPQVEAIILASTKNRHEMPPELNGKRVVGIALNGGGLF